MKTNAIDFISNKIELHEGLYGCGITTNLVKSWLLEFEKLEIERRIEQDEFFKEFEASDRQYPEELFIPTNKQQLQ